MARTNTTRSKKKPALTEEQALQQQLVRARDTVEDAFSAFAYEDARNAKKNRAGDIIQSKLTIDLAWTHSWLVVQLKELEQMLEATAVLDLVQQETAAQAEKEQNETAEDEAA